MFAFLIKTVKLLMLFVDYIKEMYVDTLLYNKFVYSQQRPVNCCICTGMLSVFSLIAISSMWYLTPDGNPENFMFVYVTLTK